MQAIILCGGLSTRLGEVTKSIPKIMLEVKGRSVLDWQLANLKTAGIDEVVMAAGHLSDILQEMAGIERRGIKLKYAIEPERLGTGGAIKFAWQHLSRPDDSVMVLNGDILSAVKVSQMSEKLRPESEGMILGAKVEDASSYGTLIFEETGRLLEFREKEGEAKSAHINGGFYLFTPSAKKYFDELEGKFSVEYDIFPKMKDLDVFASEDHWIDIGEIARLEWARQHWPEDLYELED